MRNPSSEPNAAHPRKHVSCGHDLESRRHVSHGIGQKLSGRGTGPSAPSTASIDRRTVTNRDFRKFVNATG